MKMIFRTLKTILFISETCLLDKYKMSVEKRCTGICRCREMSAGKRRDPLGRRVSDFLLNIRGFLKDIKSFC